MTSHGWIGRRFKEVGAMVWALAVVSVRGSIRTPWGGGDLGEVAAMASTLPMAEALPVIAILRFF